MDERRSRAPLVIFIEERELSAAQSLSLKILYYSNIQQISLLSCKENVQTPLKMTKMAKFRGKEPVISLNMLLFINY